MAGFPAFPREAFELNINPTSIITRIRAYHPKFQSLVFLIVSAGFFICSNYLKTHLEEEGTYFRDIFLVFLILITGPRPMVRARQRLMAKLNDCLYALIQGVSAVLSFTFFHWLGKKIMDEKDLYMAISSILFFFYLLSIRVIYEITDDLGISQGFLISGYTLLLRDYPKFPNSFYISCAFTILLAIMNTAQPPRNQRYDEIQLDPTEMPPLEDDEEESQVLPALIIVRIGNTVPTVPVPAVHPVPALAPSNHRTGDGGWALPESWRWSLARPNSTNWRLNRPNSMDW